MFWDDRLLIAATCWTAMTAIMTIPLGVVNVWAKHAWWINEMWNTWVVIGLGGAFLIWAMWFVAWVG